MRDIAELTNTLQEFARARDWEQYHTPKNLVMALVAEAGELAHIFEWLTPEESQTLDAIDFGFARDEMVDVFIYLVRLADVMGVDLIQAAYQKIEKNAEKYPANGGQHAH